MLLSCHGTSSLRISLGSSYSAAQGRPAAVLQKRAWEKRYQLMKQWSAVVKGAGSSKASTVWWSNWLNVRWRLPFA